MTAPIAERVKFWEEQQRINSLLVPRMVECTKAVEAVGATVARLVDAAAAADARVDAAERQTRGASEAAESARKVAETLAAEVKQVKETLRTARDEASRIGAVLEYVRSLGARVAALENSATEEKVRERRYVLGVTIATACAVSAVALGLALFGVLR